MTELLLLAVALALVLACGGFVAAEFAFVTVDRGVVDRAAEKGDITGFEAQALKLALSGVRAAL